MMHVFRLTNGMDLKKEIVKYCKEHKICAGYIVSAVGCCKEINFRLAGAENFYHSVADYEIVSAMGTISEDGVHIHVSFSDVDGVTVGGHLSDGCIINTTCEIVIGVIGNYKLTREFDDTTGYKELCIEKI